MPYSAKRFCPSPGCRVLVERGKCEAHSKRVDVRHERGTKPTKYNSRAWRDRLQPMKLRADPLCAHCLKAGVVKEANEVHHRNGNHDDDSWDNLESLCKSCHSRITVREHGGFGLKPQGGSKSP
jgi:5-methylcytosine-specific restriction protein A